jgi:hypothetical protein
MGKKHGRQQYAGKNDKFVFSRNTIIAIAVIGVLYQ